MQKIFVQIQNEIRRKVLAKEFERLHNIPYMIRTINGSHIYVLALIIGEDDYYYCKSFHLALLQKLIDRNYIF